MEQANSHVWEEGGVADYAGGGVRGGAKILVEFAEVLHSLLNAHQIWSLHRCEGAGEGGIEITE